jgi:POT family proton-dependent oligopeptide transporter
MTGKEPSANKEPSASEHPGSEPERTLLGHPAGLAVLFLTEMWERFSYYGMRALLILYLTKHFLLADGTSSLIFGSYVSLVYAMPVLGGLTADRYLGLHRAVMFGAILLCCGHLGMAFEGPPATITGGEIHRSALHTQTLYLSLAFIIIGVGFLKPNISTIVGRLYPADDPRRDSGFTIFYMGINLGAFVATLACAWLGENWGWRWGFGLAGVGMLAGLGIFHRGRGLLKGAGAPPDLKSLQTRVAGGLTREHWIYALGLVAVLVAWQFLQHAGELGVALGIFGAISVGYVIFFSIRECNSAERSSILVMLGLMAFSVLFWSLFEQAGTSLTLFTDRNVIMGDTLTAGMFQSFNAGFIMLLAPLFSVLWVWLNRRGWEPSTPAKFALATVQVGLGFAVLVYGANQSGDGRVAAIWLITMYLLHTTGELCLSPVGLSMVTRLSVARIASMMMGVWFLSSAFAGYAGGLIASAMAVPTGDAPLAPAESLSVYVSVFGDLALIAIIAGCALLVLSPWLRRFMRHAETPTDAGQSPVR